ncbi:MAG: hypothetical protein H6628_04810 [Calditrichae bacterium]|nr:hypothetical protein [Calditrichia bacterium]
MKSEPSREGGDNSGYQKYLQILKNNSQAFQTASERVTKILASLKILPGWMNPISRKWIFTRESTAP